MGHTRKKDLFPVYMGLSFTVLAATTVALVIAGHPVWAIVTGVACALVAGPLSGWFVAWAYLEADLVVTIRANGGQMPITRLATLDTDDRLITHLVGKGVLSFEEETVFLHEDEVGRVLAFFVRLRLAK